MAYNKEAICIVLDVGESMGSSSADGDSSLKTSIHAITMILQRMMFSETKNEVSLVLFGTDNTANDLNTEDPECYKNITLAQPLRPVDWNFLNYVESIESSQTSGDFIDALIVALDHLVKQVSTKRGFANKRLILFTDLSGACNKSQLKDIIAGMIETKVELNSIGPDLDNLDSPVNGGGGGDGEYKPLTGQQRESGKLLQRMIADVNGASYSFSEALPALSYFQTRQVKPVAWKCQLEVGPDLRIPISGYQKIKEAKPRTFKTVYAKDPDAETERLTTYHLNDEEETEVEKSDTVEGHRYGNTLVPFSDVDKEVMKYKAEKCFKILGFTKSEMIKRHHFMGDSIMCVMTDKDDEAASTALSALIHALYETNCVAITRRVYSAATSAKLGCLTPQIKSDNECLLYNELPFAEDIRQFTFGSLPIGKEAEPVNKKFKPSDSQLSIMDELIDNMDLTNSQRDENGDSEESFKPKHLFNPHLQRLYQCLQNRATHPNDTLPELSKVIADSLELPASVESQCKDTVKKLKETFKLERVISKKETDKNIFNESNDTNVKVKVQTDDTLAGGMAGLSNSVKEVGTVTPVDDFIYIVSKEMMPYHRACEMMEKRVIQLVKDSFGKLFYGKTVDCLKCYRSQSIKVGNVAPFNNFLKQFKCILKDEGRENFLDELKNEWVSLISKEECESSTVSQQESEEFFKSESEKPDVKPPLEESEDEEDLLAMME